MENEKFDVKSPDTTIVKKTIDKNYPYPNHPPYTCNYHLDKPIYSYHHKMLYINDLPMQPSQKENDTLNLTVSKNKDATAPLNCYEGFTPTIESIKVYSNAEAIVEDFELNFYPRAYGENLVIWENGVDKLILNNDIRKFIKEQYALSFIEFEFPASEAKKCYNIINHRIKTKYDKYPLESVCHILFGNGHLNINNEISQNNPKVFTSESKIDTIRCKYRVNASFLPSLDQTLLEDYFCNLTPSNPFEIDKFICKISSGIPAIMCRIWEMIGYLLTPDTNGRCFFVLCGEPESGKSLLVKIIMRLFDSKYISNLSLSQLGKTSATNTLLNKQINVSMDLPNGALAPSAISFLKQSTGNDLNADNWISQENNKLFGQCKFLFATNHPLTVRGIDTAFERRIINIPFLSSIPLYEQDRDLYQKLEKELNYIATKAIYFYKLLVLDNYKFAGYESELFVPPITTLSSVSDIYNYSIKHFAKECCWWGDYKIFTIELYNDYLEYCKEKNIIPIRNIQAFSRAFKMHFEHNTIKSRWRAYNDTNLTGFKGITTRQRIITGTFQTDKDYSTTLNQPNPYNTTYDNNTNN